MQVHLTNKATVNKELTAYVKERANTYGVLIEEVAISQSRVPKEVAKAIQDRQKIAQELEKQKLELQKTEIAKQQAQLEAERRIIEAKGDAEANKIIQQSMSPELMNYKATMEYLKKWDGKRPNVETTNGNGLIVDVGEK